MGRAYRACHRRRRHRHRHRRGIPFTRPIRTLATYTRGQTGVSRAYHAPLTRVSLFTRVSRSAGGNVTIRARSPVDRDQYPRVIELGNARREAAEWKGRREEAPNRPVWSRSPRRGGSSREVPQGRREITVAGHGGNRSRPRERSARNRAANVAGRATVFPQSSRVWYHGRRCVYSAYFFLPRRRGVAAKRSYRNARFPCVTIALSFSSAGFPRVTRGTGYRRK